MAKVEFARDFKEFLALLDSEKIEYLLIGGYAVSLHGHVRATNDMDVWVAPDTENLQRLKSALIQYGFAPSSIPKKLFEPPAEILRIGQPPLRVEIFNKIPGIDFAPAYARRVEVIADGAKLNLIHLEDLRANKKATGRPKDLLDVEELSRIKP
jgi:predicted nucleotidyltransferase